MPNAVQTDTVWSPAKTVAWYGVIFAVDLVLQTVILLVATGLAMAPSAGREDFALALRAMAHDGQVFVAAALVSATLVISAVSLLSRRKGGSAVEYLAIHPISLWRALPWMLTGVAFSFAQVAVFDVVHLSSTDFWHGIYLSSWIKPALFLAMVVVAPAAEEILYRGFLFRGLLNSRLGAPGAVVLTSLAWASVHMQYNLCEKGTILALGLLLGALRYRKSSLTIPFLIHVGVNATGFFMMMAGFRAPGFSLSGIPFPVGLADNHKTLPFPKFTGSPR